MKRLCLLATACLLFAGATATAESARKNVLFILADDLGCRDMTIEGSTFYETPNIDRIAEGGMRFTQGYACCQVCSPSRASIMTGQFTARHGITDWIGAGAEEGWGRNTILLPPQYVRNLPAEDTTLAEAMCEAGYRTFFAGKWHLGSKGSWPTDHGFEFNVAGWDKGSPAGGYFAPYSNPNIENGPDGESLPLRLGQETASFIEEHQDEPFLAYLSFYSVHGPIQTTPELWEKYRLKSEADPHEGPRFMIDRTLPVRQVQDNPIYAGMMESMDSAVGIVLDKLDELGLSDDTIVVFTSDNGGVSSGDAFATSNLPLRGGKGRQWEGGIREPYYVLAPGITEPGSTCDTPVTGADFYPTLLDLVGAPLRPEQHLDGRSIVPLLEGESIDARDLYWHYPHYGNQGGEPCTIIRSGDWKLIHYWEDGRDELYNITEDEIEQNDLATSEEEIRDALRSKVDVFIEETDANLPYPNPKYDADLAVRQQESQHTNRLPSLEHQAENFLSPEFTPNATWWGSTVD